MSEQVARDIEILAALFKAGGWTELRVVSEGISLLLSTDPATPPIGDGRSPMPAVASVSEARPATGSGGGGAPAPAAPVSIDPAWVAIAAPNLGTFYRSPKPGAPPFVEVDQRVEADTEICLIEVMKLFTSVKAGIAGTVRHIAATDAELVEGGQALFYIERE